MPTYSYKCDCGTITDVVRPMKDIDIGPDNGCEKCGSKDLKRTIIVDTKGPNFILEGTGWHRDQYMSHRSRN